MTTLLKSLKLFISIMEDLSSKNVSLFLNSYLMTGPIFHSQAISEENNTNKNSVFKSVNLSIQKLNQLYKDFKCTKWIQMCFQSSWAKLFLFLADFYHRFYAFEWNILWLLCVLFLELFLYLIILKINLQLGWSHDLRNHQDLMQAHL